MSEGSSENFATPKNSYLGSIQDPNRSQLQRDSEISKLIYIYIYMQYLGNIPTKCQTLQTLSSKP